MNSLRWERKRKNICKNDLKVWNFLLSISNLLLMLLLRVLRANRNPSFIHSNLRFPWVLLCMKSTSVVHIMLSITGLFIASSVLLLSSESHISMYYSMLCFWMCLLSWVTLGTGNTLITDYFAILQYCRNRNSRKDNANTNFRYL